MSDLNIHDSGASVAAPPSQVTAEVVKHLPPLPPLNPKSVDKLRKYGKNLTVDNDLGSGMSLDGEDEEPLLPVGSAPVPIIRPSSSLPHQGGSPLLRPKHPESGTFKGSPRLIRQNPIAVPSPHGSPKTQSKLNPVAFFVGSESQTDRAPVPLPTAVPLADMKEMVEEEEAEEKNQLDQTVALPDPPAAHRPVPGSLARAHKDSFREMSELEPIDEQLERSELSPINSKSPLEDD